MLFKTLCTIYTNGWCLYFFVLLLTKSSADNQFSEIDAQSMMFFSAGAYADSAAKDQCIMHAKPKEEQWTGLTSGSVKCDTIKNPCSYYTAISHVRKEIVVVFRGSKDRVQMAFATVISLMPGTKFFDLGKVHRYFYNGLELLWMNVLNVLSDTRYTGYSVTFTGHSLGGAMASLAAARTVYKGIRQKDQVKLYTFGAPRVGSSEYAFNHDKLVPHSYRVVNSDDFITRLPPCSDKLLEVIINFNDVINRTCDPKTAGVSYHHGTEIWYKDGMPDIRERHDPATPKRYQICEGLPRNEDIFCVASVQLDLPKNWQKYNHTHIRYFGHKVSAFGKLGCAPDKEKEEEELSRKEAEESKAQTLSSKLFKWAKSYMPGKGPLEVPVEEIELQELKPWRESNIVVGQGPQGIPVEKIPKARNNDE